MVLFHHERTSPRKWCQFVTFSLSELLILFKKFVSIYFIYFLTRKWCRFVDRLCWKEFRHQTPICYFYTRISWSMVSYVIYLFYMDLWIIDVEFRVQVIHPRKATLFILCLSSCSFVFNSAMWLLGIYLSWTRKFWRNSGILVLFAISACFNIHSIQFSLWRIWRFEKIT